MPGFLRAATIVLTSSAVVCVGVLTVLPSVPDGPWSAGARAAGVPVAELPRASCKQQLWPNTDRVCQSWTVANKDVAELLSASTAPSSPAQTNLLSAAAVSESSTSAEPVDGLPRDSADTSAPVEPVPQVVATTAAAAPRAARDEKSALAGLRGPDAHHEIAVTAQSGDGSRRVIMIHPTSSQDQFYYSAHRDLAAAVNSTLGR
jgi:hypothetical protein